MVIVFWLIVGSWVSGEEEKKEKGGRGEGKGENIEIMVGSGGILVFMYFLIECFWKELIS